MNGAVSMYEYYLLLKQKIVFLVFVFIDVSTEKHSSPK